MTEDFLRQLSITDVFNLMTQSMKDLMDAQNRQDETEIRANRELLGLLQRFLVAKRAEFLPG